MKLPYFKLGEALRDVKWELEIGSGLDKAGAVAKLVGKTAANLGMGAIEAGVVVAKALPAAAARQAQETLKANPDMPTEQRQKLRDFIDQHKPDHSTHP